MVRAGVSAEGGQHGGRVRGLMKFCWVLPKVPKRAQTGPSPAQAGAQVLFVRKNKISDKQHT